MITKEQFSNSIKDEEKRQELGKALLALEKAYACKVQIVWVKDHIEIIEGK